MKLTTTTKLDKTLFWDFFMVAGDTFFLFQSIKLSKAFGYM